MSTSICYKWESIRIIYRTVTSCMLSANLELVFVFK